MKKDALILIAGRGLQAILTIILFRVLTQVLPPEQAGGVYLIFSVSYLFTSFLINPVSTYINRKLFLWHDTRTIFSHLAGYNYYVAAVSLLAFPTVWFAWRSFGVGSGLSGLVFAAEVSCYIYVLTWNITFIPILNALGHKMAFVSLTIAATGLGLLFSPAFAYFGSASAEYWMAGQIVALGLVTAVSVRVFVRKVPEASAGAGVRKYLEKDALAGVGKFALPLAVSALFMWGQGQSYRVIVEKMSGAEFLGYLGVGFSIATSVAGILESLVQQIYMPGFYRKITGADKAGRGEALSELAAKTMPVYLIYLFFVFGVSEFLVYFLVAEKYHAVFIFARYGAFIEFFRMATNVLGAGAYSEMRTRALIKPYFWGGAVAVVGVYFASLSTIPGVLVPLALVASGLVTVLGMGVAIRAMTPIRFDYLPMGKVILASSLFLPLAFLPASSLWPSLGVLTAAGIYFTFLQYRAARKWMRGADIASRSLPATENVSPAEQ